MYNAVRLKQLPLTETTDVAMPVHGKSAQEQFFKVIFQEMQIHARASINTAFSIWLEAITN
jgi:regulation of enolase protein 1 (concanavalin A-like superfamily)